jgi:hypothetical protein
MMTPAQSLIARAFRHFPIALEAFCTSEGIPFPPDFDGATSTDPPFDNTRPRPAPEPKNYGDTPIPRSIDSARPRSKEGRRNFASTDPMQMGPVRGADGRLRIHACCPRAWRQSRGYPEPRVT